MRGGTACKSERHSTNLDLVNPSGVTAFANAEDTPGGLIKSRPSSLHMTTQARPSGSTPLSPPTMSSAPSILIYELKTNIYWFLEAGQHRARNRNSHPFMLFSTRIWDKLKVHDWLWLHDWNFNFIGGLSLRLKIGGSRWVTFSVCVVSWLLN
jgi:hypothetical protein